MEQEHLRCHLEEIDSEDFERKTNVGEVLGLKWPDDESGEEKCQEKYQEDGNIK